MFRLHKTVHGKATATIARSSLSATSLGRFVIRPTIPGNLSLLRGLFFQLKFAFVPRSSQLAKLCYQGFWQVVLELVVQTEAKGQIAPVESKECNIAEGSFARNHSLL